MDWCSTVRAAVRHTLPSVRAAQRTLLLPTTLASTTNPRPLPSARTHMAMPSTRAPNASATAAMAPRSAAPSSSSTSHVSSTSSTWCGEGRAGLSRGQRQQGRGHWTVARSSALQEPRAVRDMVVTPPQPFPAHTCMPAAAHVHLHVHSAPGTTGKNPSYLVGVGGALQVLRHVSRPAAPHRPAHSANVGLHARRRLQHAASLAHGGGQARGIRHVQVDAYVLQEAGSGTGSGLMAL